MAVLGLSAWYIFGQSEPTPWNKPATVDGATVRLTYTGSACRDGADVKVDEDPQTVVLTVRETVRATSCADVGVLYGLEVLLDAPLGDRNLVDGACPMSDYSHHTACGPDAPEPAA